MSRGLCFKLSEVIKLNLINIPTAGGFKFNISHLLCHSESLLKFWKYSSM